MVDEQPTRARLTAGWWLGFVLLWVGVVGTMLWLIWGGLRHFGDSSSTPTPA
jgi:hypothetical protein